MGNIHTLPLASRRAPDLLAEILSGMAEGYNRMIELGRFDKPSTKVMVGYLAASSIALRCTGMADAANDFQRAGEAINTDWKCFQKTIEFLASTHELYPQSR